MSFEPKTFSDILQRFAQRIVARSALTDLEEGGNVHTIGAGLARELDDAYFQMTRLKNVWDIDTASGEDLDERGLDCNPDEMTRLLASKASGSVVFSRTGTTGTVSIPTGTTVSVSGGVQFVTTADGTIADGDTQSASVPILAVEAGEDGNVDDATITQLAGVAGVETVTNGAATTGGQEQETDAQFRSRIKSYLRSLPRGTPDAIRFAALTAELEGFGRVTSVTVIELEGDDLGQVEVYVDDGAGTTDRRDTTGFLSGDGEVVVASAGGGERRLNLAQVPITPGSTVSITINGGSPIVEGTDYTLDRSTGRITLDDVAYPTGLTIGDVVLAYYEWFTGLVQQAQKIINGDPADRATYPGYRAAGTQVFVLPPTVLQQSVDAQVVLKSGFDGVTVRAAVKSAIVRYINSLGVGDDVVHSELVHQAKAVPGVYDVTVSVPSANTAIGDTELARCVDANVTVT